MLNRGSIRFYINGPPPIAKHIGEPYPVNLADIQQNPYEINLIDSNPKPDTINLPTTTTHGVLLTVRSIRIFDFFPDKLIIDENKISFIYKGAFGVKSIHSVLIENITYVEAHTSILTGCLVVIDSSNYRHPIELKIDNLRKEAAIRARKLIQGLIHARTLNMDFSKYNSFEMESNLEEFGMVKGED